eukprot:TRINITY_DN65664_c0_g1_i1.p1 TRINITY_DN65664_c0_g1~~TRINITY_DN65664_c0_g1_i1.p1  ORF type:complete len:133 (-),score=28.61 TRINITY_DN65664_c0_g1_i1:57-455(-)
MGCGAAVAKPPKEEEEKPAAPDATPGKPDTEIYEKISKVIGISDEEISIATETGDPIKALNDLAAEKGFLNLAKPKGPFKASLEEDGKITQAFGTGAEPGMVVAYVNGEPYTFSLLMQSYENDGVITVRKPE